MTRVLFIQSGRDHTGLSWLLLCGSQIWSLVQGYELVLWWDSADQYCKIKVQYHPFSLATLSRQHWKL